MKTNPILDTRVSGRRAIGTWLSIGNTFVAETVARQGFDYVAIDLQHGSIGWDGLGPVIQAIELGGSCAVVRVPWNTPDAIMRALDFGAVGVIVPMISTPEEARRASEAVRYPPHGNRSFGSIRSSYTPGMKPPEVACLVMIETRAGAENIAEIAATPGVDGLFVGPADLSLDLGLPLSLTPPPPVLEVIDKMISVCATAGIVAGSASLSSATAEDFLNRGVQFLTLSSDLAYMRKGLQEDFDFVNRWRDSKKA